MKDKIFSILKQERFKNFFFFSSASFISAFISIITLPIFTSYMSPDEFGIWSFALTFNSFVGTIIVFDLHSYFLIENSKGEIDKKQVLSTLVSFSFFWSTILILLFVGFGFLFFDSLFKGISFYPYILYIIISNLFLCFSLFLQIIYRIENKPFFYFLFSIFQSLSSVFFSLIAVIYFLHDSQGRILGFSFGLLISGFIAFVILKTKYSFQFQIDKTLIKKALKFSAPLIPYSIALLSMDFLDRIFIEKYCSIRDLGLFGLASQINTIIYFIFISLIRVYEPSIINWVNNAKHQTLNIFAFKYNTILFVSVVLLMIFSGFIIHNLTNDKYENSIDLIIKLSPFFYFKTLSLLLVTILISSFKTYKTMYITLFLLMLYLIFGFYYIPQYGIDGMILIKTIISGIGCVIVFLYLGSIKSNYKFILNFVFTSILIFIFTFVIFNYRLYI